MSIAVFPGSFDPITIGHVDLVKRALPLFEKIFVAIGHNSQKKTLFSLEQRIKQLESTFKNEANVEISSYEGLTIEYCKEVGASHLIRGLRSSADFEFEKTVAQLNKSMAEDLETVFLISRPEYAHISSSVVREIITNEGNYSDFVPDGVSFA